MSRFQSWAALFTLLALLAVCAFQNSVIENQAQLIREFSQDPRCMGAPSNR